MLEATSLWAESGPSLQVRYRKSSAKEADTQGISPFFCCVNAANGGYDPITLPQGLLD
jgi:hypothetical protein